MLQTGTARRLWPLVFLTSLTAEVSASDPTASPSKTPSEDASPEVFPPPAVPARALPELPAGASTADLSAQKSLASLAGRVLEAGSRDPLEDVAVVIEALGLEIYTDVEGRFDLPELPPGTHEIKLVFPRYVGQVQRLTFVAGERQAVLWYLRPKDGTTRYAMEVVGERQRQEVTLHSIQLSELERIPGTYGDPVKAVQNLPGMARSPFGLGFLVVRGTGPNDTGTYVDGIRVPILFHFGGLVSIFSGSMLEKVDYLPGGFPARYGRSLGGVVDLKTHDFLASRLHGHAEVDVLNSAFYLQGPIRSDLSFSIAARRSYIDFIANPIVAMTTGLQIRLPRYWDVQARLDYAFSPTTTFSLLYYSSDDRFEVLGEAGSDADEDSAQQARFGTYITQNKLQGRMKQVFGSSITHMLDVAVGPEKQNIQFGAGEIRLEPFKLSIRDEWQLQALPWLTVRGGLDLLSGLNQFIIDIPSVEGIEGSSSVLIEKSALSLAPAPYLEVDLLVGDQLRLLPGLRLDPLWVPDNYWSFTADPRLTFRSQAAPQTILKGGIGKYSQPAGIQQYLAELDNPDLRSEYAVQGAVGIEHRLTPSVLFDSTVYYGELYDLIRNGPGGGTFKLIAPAAGIDPGDEPAFENGSIGRTYGLEVLLRHDLTDRFFGWVSYSLSRSERRREDVAEWDVFNLDQTHILTILGSYKLPRGLEVSARFRYSTGVPFTPVIDAYQELDSGQFTPLYGETDSARNPPFHALDLRVDKRWTFDRWKLEGYLDIQNVYNRANPEAGFYSYDFTERTYIQGLPILPVLGLRGEF